jgi:hypothetical protein
MSDELNELENLKSEAATLGVTHSNSIGLVKLKEKIEKHYTDQETSGPEVAALVEKAAAAEKTETIETTETAETVRNEISFSEKRITAEKKARKTRVVMIIDNDQRINNHTTTCTVNCSNAYFSLGTKLLPLNEKIEVAQGHINVLKEVRIPLHAHDPKTGLSITKMRARYSISYEDVE